MQTENFEVRPWFGDKNYCLIKGPGHDQMVIPREFLQEFLFIIGRYVGNLEYEGNIELDLTEDYKKKK